MTQPGALGIGKTQLPGPSGPDWPPLKMRIISSLRGAADSMIVLPATTQAANDQLG